MNLKKPILVPLVLQIPQSIATFATEHQLLLAVAIPPATVPMNDFLAITSRADRN